MVARFPPSVRRATLIEDARLDTGIINPDLGATAVSIGFLVPVVNRPGTDAFLLEFDPNTVAERGDALQVQINGNTVLFPSSEGVELLSNLAADVYQSTSGNVDTLAELENDAFTKTSDTTQSIYGYPIDLSDFGIALNGSIMSLQFGASGITSTRSLLLGCQRTAQVPEPTGIAIWSLLGLGLSGFCYYRTCRKK